MARSKWKLTLMLGGVILAATACDPGSSTGPATESPVPSRVAYVVQEGGLPALYVQNADGSGRTRIHFTGAVQLPGNPDLLPPLTDENLLALGPLAWSPDGSRLAVVATLAYDESELVVLNADGSGARVASLNSQIIMTAPDWSPDGTKLAYGMSTLSHAGGVQLFVTDLTANSWRQLTNSDPVGSAGTDLRWSTDASTIYLWRTIGQAGTPHDWLSRISAVDTGTGAARVLVDSLTGMVQDVGRNGTWALVIRNVAETPGQDAVRDLVRRPLVGLGPELKLVQGNLWWARAAADDRGLTIVSDGNSSPAANSFTASVLPIGGGQLVAISGLDTSAYVLDVLFR